MRIKHAVSAIAVVVAGAASGHASAFVPAWDFTTASGFFFNGGLAFPNPQCDTGDATTCSISASQGDTPAAPGSVSRLAWGTPLNADNQQSGAQIFNGTSGTTVSPTPFLGLTAVEVEFGQIVTNGDWEATGYLAQYNNIIEVPGFFASGLFVSNFTLSEPGVGNVPGFDPANIPLAVDFLESTNNGICNQTPNPLGTNCDDRIIIDRLPSNIVTGIPFMYDGMEYTIQSRISGFQGSVVFDGGTRDIVYTPENSPGISYLLLETRITSPREVPAPGVLALLGIGLFGITARLRRRAS